MTNEDVTRNEKKVDLLQFLLEEVYQLMKSKVTENVDIPVDESSEDSADSKSKDESKDVPLPDDPQGTFTSIVQGHVNDIIVGFEDILLDLNAPFDVPDDRIKLVGETVRASLEQKADLEARGAEGTEVRLSSHSEQDFHVESRAPPPPFE